MAISPITDPAQTATSRQSLANNFDTFLTLLTAQLQNQDPLSPMDSTQFTQQLVQFSQVEQQIRTNEQLTGLAGQFQAATAGTALSYLGRDAVIESDTASLSGGQANWTYGLDNAAAEVKLEVQDAHGRTIFTAAGPGGAGNHAFAWDGATDSGAKAQDGQYKLAVTATNADGADIAARTTVLETIMGVDFSGASPLVITRSGSRGLDTIRAVLDGG